MARLSVGYGSGLRTASLIRSPRRCFYTRVSTGDLTWRIEDLLRGVSRLFGLVDESQASKHRPIWQIPPTTDVDQRSLAI